eukprot:scaffold239666_cov36-Cyclotella_meneghiniana.AAC.1
MIRAYDTIILCLKGAGSVPKKTHVLDNEVSEAMKNHIRDDLKLNMELCSCRHGKQFSTKLMGSSVNSLATLVSEKISLHDLAISRESEVAGSWRGM